MVGASGANWRLCLNWLSPLLVVPIERPHGLQQVTYTQQGGIDGQDVGAMARKQLPSQHSGVGPYGGLTTRRMCQNLHRWGTQKITIPPLPNPHTPTSYEEEKKSLATLGTLITLTFITEAPTV